MARRSVAAATNALLSFQPCMGLMWERRGGKAGKGLSGEGIDADGTESSRGTRALVGRGRYPPHQPECARTHSPLGESPPPPARPPAPPRTPHPSWDTNQLTGRKRHSRGHAGRGFRWQRQWPAVASSDPLRSAADTASHGSVSVTNWSSFSISLTPSQGHAFFLGPSPTLLRFLFPANPPAPPSQQ